MTDETTQTVPPASRADDAETAAATPTTRQAAVLPPPPPGGPRPGGAAAAAASAPTGERAAASAGSPVPPPPPAAPPAPPSSPRRGRRGVAVLTAAGLMLASAAGGAAIALALDDDGSPATPVASSLAEPVTGGDTSSAAEPLAQVADAVLPSVVSISFDAGQLSGSGSGLVISEDGLILTNNHVVAQAADGGSLTVTFSDGSTADAAIVGRDPATDLAVIEAEDVSGLTPATFGSSDDLTVGDTVLAIGSPLGLDGSVTSGIVSAKNRAITLQGESDGRSPFGGSGSSARDVAVINAIQTDAAINPGNSGGALINADGEVIGVNTAIASLAQGTSSQGGNIGVGFAIPIDAARDIAEQLIDDGSVTHAYLGVSVADAESGALVGAVEDGTPAADAGLAEGDVVTAVDGDRVGDASALTAAVRSHAPGDEIEVTYVRDGDEQTVQVTLGELPE
jgi:putative serine protease PepD